MPYDSTMGLVWILLLIFVGAPIARAVAKNIERRGLPPTQDENELKRALQLAEQRLSEGETRIAALEDRLDFYEKLLANPEKPN
jgi:hypothetical protein